jgi:hypothetical protein
MVRRNQLTGLLRRLLLCSTSISPCELEQYLPPQSVYHQMSQRSVLAKCLRVNFVIVRSMSAANPPLLSFFRIPFLPLLVLLKPASSQHHRASWSIHHRPLEVFQLCRKENKEKVQLTFRQPRTDVQTELRGLALILHRDRRSIHTLIKADRRIVRAIFRYFLHS